MKCFSLGRANRLDCTNLFTTHHLATDADVKTDGLVAQSFPPGKPENYSRTVSFLEHALRDHALNNLTKLKCSRMNGLACRRPHSLFHLKKTGKPGNYL